MEYKVTLPPGLETIDICNPPEDLDFVIRRNFYQFSHGTSKEFKYLDKLRYIDYLVRNLRRLDLNLYRRSCDVLVDRVKNMWLEGNDIIEELKSDNQLMIDFYKKGIDHASISRAFSDDKDLDLMIKKFLAEVIQFVMNYED